MTDRLNSEGARRLVLAAPINAHELAVRIIEAYHGMKRPENETATDCINKLDERDRNGAMRAAAAAVTYLAECVSSNQGSVQ